MACCLTRRGDVWGKENTFRDQDFILFFIESGIPKKIHHPGGVLKLKEACTLLQVVIPLH